MSDLDVVLIVRGDPAKDLNPNNYTPNPLRPRGGFEKYRRLKKTWSQRARWEWEQIGKPEISGKVTCQIDIRRGRKLDPDNAFGIVKPLLDGLTKRKNDGVGLILDDSDYFVEYLPIIQTTGAPFSKDPHVVFEFRVKRE